MNDWSEGYVTEISYTSGFYRELVPSFIGFVGLLAGVDVPLWRKRPIRYLELGCGKGVTACIVATANPQMEVVALDFDPTHIAEGQSLADSAGICNIQFVEMSFEQARDDPSLGSFDFICLHGIYSWVGPDVRRQIVELLKTKLRTAGVVYISYNSYPGRVAYIPLQRLLSEVADEEPGIPVTDRLAKGMDLLDRLQTAGAGYFKVNPSAGALLKDFKQRPPNYLIHEYLHRNWTPFFFSDIATDFASAKLEYIGSADLLLYLDGINLTPDQQSILKEATNKFRRQLIRDLILNRSFRRDLFIRGARRLSPAEVELRWLESRFALLRPREDIPLKITAALGEIPLEVNWYGPVIARLAEKAQTVRELLSDRTIEALGRPRLKQVLTVLVAQNVCQPALPEAGESERRQSTDQFNNALLTRAATEASLPYLASPVTGSGVRVDQVGQLALLAVREKAKDISDFIWKALSAQGHQVVKDGKPVATRVESLEVISAGIKSLNSMSHVLTRLGIY